MPSRVARDGGRRRSTSCCHRAIIVSWGTATPRRPVPTGTGIPRQILGVPGLDNQRGTPNGTLEARTFLKRDTHPNNPSARPAGASYASVATSAAALPAPQQPARPMTKLKNTISGITFRSRTFAQRQPGSDRMVYSTPGRAHPQCACCSTSRTRRPNLGCDQGRTERHVAHVYPRQRAHTPAGLWDGTPLDMDQAVRSENFLADGVTTSCVPPGAG